jgi:spoIIIJ-associated protein
MSEQVVEEIEEPVEPPAGDGAQADAPEPEEAEQAEESEAAEEAEEPEGDDLEDLDDLDAEGDIAADYLEELLDIADLDGDIDTYTEGDRAHVSIVTDSEQLVGRDGEVLEALQELARLAVLTETGRRSRLMLDVAGHREKRRKELQTMAADAVSEVQASGETIRLAPMNPFERKIVHDVVAAAGLVSESEGAEPQRRVVISPAPASAEAEPAAE